MDIDSRELPIVIQGGMGAGISGWRLANAVARTGQLGVVSGTALNLIMARRSVARFRLIEAECGPSHGTILLRARNAHGGSYFAIVESATVLWVPPDVTVC